MHFLVYQITNNLNGKIYVGVHQTTNPNDGYMGSGTLIKQAIKRHGASNFTKTILYDFSSLQEMNDKEIELVTPEFVQNPQTYNMVPGGSERNWVIIDADGNKICCRATFTPEQIAMGRDRVSELWNDTAWAANQRAKLSANVKRYYQNKPGGHWLGQKHSPEAIAKQKLAAVGRSAGSKNPLFGKKWMTDGSNSKPATKEEQETLLTLGWRYGRIIT